MSKLLISVQSTAINLANLTEASKVQTVILAARTGAELIKVKEAMAHGEYLPWVKEFMPIKAYQCTKYVKLAKENPALLESNNSLASYLDIDSELKLLSLDDEVAESTRDTANELELSRKEVGKLISELKSTKSDSDRTIEEWRQQFLDERNGKRELKGELERVKATKKQTVYVDDSEKALKQYKEETTEKLNDFREKKIQAEAKLMLVEREKHEAIAQGVTDKLQDYEDKISTLQQQETCLTSSIEQLSDKWDELDNSHGVRVDQINARKKYKDHMELAFLCLDALQEDAENLTDEDKEEWKKLMDNTYRLADEFKSYLD